MKGLALVQACELQEILDEATYRNTELWQQYPEYHELSYTVDKNGKAKAVLQDVASFEETQETLALLKILAVGNQDLEEGRVKPVADVVARLRAKRATA